MYLEDYIPAVKIYKNKLTEKMLLSECTLTKDNLKDSVREIIVNFPAKEIEVSFLPTNPVLPGSKFKFIVYVGYLRIGKCFIDKNSKNFIKDLLTEACVLFPKHTNSLKNMKYKLEKYLKDFPWK